MATFRILLTGALVTLSVVVLGPIQAAKVKVWQQHSQTHYDKAKFKDAVVTSEGNLRLARQLRPLADPETMHVWDVLEDPQGNLILATGDEGKLFRVAADGKISLLTTSNDGMILSLAQAPDGTLYAGTGPSGQVLRIGPDGIAQTFAEGLDSYVWGLVYEPASKTLYAATGPKGRIFQITSEGKASVFFTTKQEHVLCLARGPKETLYAGTDKGGLVYRIDNKGKGFVLYQASQPEIRSLLVTPDAVYAGTSAPTSRRSNVSNRATAGNSDGSGLAANPGFSKTSTKTRASAEKVEVSPAGEGSSTSSSDAKSAAASAPSTPSVGENSLYRIAPDGTVREIFRDKTLILSLARSRGRLLVGTGAQGQLFEINEATREHTEIARLDHGQIHALCQRRDGSMVVAAGDPGKVYVLENRFAQTGTVLSEILDAKIISKWGALSWKASTPTGTNVSIAVRSGNVAEPDDTWSDWSAEQVNSQDAKTLAPTARFLQYRVSLSTSTPQATPEVQHLAVRYKTTNQAPELTSLEVPDLENVNPDNPRKLKIRWTATDPNEDELTFSLFFKKDGWKDWVLLEEYLERKEFDWDTTTLPSGMYQIKVVATDRKDNAAEDVLTAERISPPVPVAHVPPTVTLKLTGVENDQALLEANATDPMVRLTEASFAVNGKRWTNVFPTDGLFDSKNERFLFKTEPLRPGTYVVVLRVRDAAGNLGSGDVLFTIPERK